MLNENDIEQLTLQRLQSLGWEYRYGKDLPVHEGEFARGDLSGVVFIEQLREAVRKLNPQLPESAVDSVVKSATKSDIGDLVVRNQSFYKLLRDGVRVEYQAPNSLGQNAQKIEMARLVDFEHWENNRFIAINQLEIRSRKGGKRIPDIIGFVNGLPLVVFELKNPLRESADLLQAFNQFETYKDEIAELFVYNQALIISDGIAARLGSLSADFQRFTPWKVVDEKAKSKRLDFGDELQNLLNGLMTPQKLLDYVRYFVLFERGSNGALIKKIAAYHQYYGVNEAVESTIFATSEQGDKRIGVMWHTQGSGKSISMLFYAGKLLTQPELKNPTIVVVTDRNDLDGQLFQTFSSGKDLIKQTPQQVEDREQLRQLLAQNEVGGVFFTTIQKFALNEEESRFPVLNERSNIIVISDEAHRSQTAANHIATLDQLPNEGKAYDQHWHNADDIEPRKKAFLKTAGSLKKGYALCGALPEIEPYSQEVAFYDAVRAVLAKREQNGKGTTERLIQLKALINQSIVSEGTIDLFDLLGKEQTQINLLSDEFLQAIKNSETKSLWVLAMERYLKQEIKTKASRNLTAQKDFEQRLQEALTQYHNHNLSVVEILDALVQMGRDFSERLSRGEKLGLSTAELAFYDALSQNESAKELMNDEMLSKLAREITDILRKSVSIDWQHK